MDTSPLFRALVALTLLTTPAAAMAQPESSDDPEGGGEQTGSDAAGEEPSADPDEEGSGAADDDGSEDTEDDQGDTAAATDSEQPESGDEGAQSGGETEPPTETAPPAQPPQSESSAGEASEEAGEGESGDSSADQSDGAGSGDGGESPISGLAESSDDEEFEPVKDIEESSLEEVTPADTYPYVELNGLFRVRSDADINFDLDTNGTSAIRPPLEANRPPGNPAKSGNELLWTADLGLRLEPTIHISESLSVHIESALLDNVVFGSLSDNRLTRQGTSFLRPDPSRTIFQENQLSPREREFFENAVQINELWGEVDTFLGEFRAGRMDNHWGLGMHSNSGDCADCDFGDHVDRIRFLTKPLGLLYTSANIDFVDQGVTSQSPTRAQGQPFDLSHLDDARQYTFSFFKKPRSQKEKKLEQQKLKEDEVPVVHGGARFTYRTQNALFTGQTTGEAREEGLGGQLVYRGLDMYVPDVWAQFLYNPDPDTLVRVEVEAVGILGDIDNATREPVGRNNDDVNCFNDDDREANPDICSSNDVADDTSEGLEQVGAAVESELYFGGPLRFGLNSGFASGGEAPNWGYQATDGSQHDFFRFDPNYHVDLILFREIIGTVTNAYYFNPYAQARFFESPDQRIEAQVDAILSRATDLDGTPAGEQGDPWLGLEFDAALRYLQIDRFEAGLEAGVLFPFGALDAKRGRPRLTRPAEAGSEFNQNRSANIPWTLQTNFIWKF